MAKGFGEKRNQQIGFTLVVIPSANAYAARTDLDYFGDDKPFFGVTSILEYARIWKTKKGVFKGSSDYIPLVLEDINDNIEEIKLEVRSVFRDKKGKLKDRFVGDI